MSDGKNIRHRFTVPANDTLVNEWIENQSNLAFSLRLLISTCAKQMGTSDITCQLLGMDRPLPRKGRPRKDAKEKLLNFNPNQATTGDYDDEDDYVEESVQEIPRQQVVRQTSEQIMPKQESVVKQPVRQTVMEPATDDILNIMSGTGSNVSNDMLDSL